MCVLDVKPLDIEFFDSVSSKLSTRLEYSSFYVSDKLYVLKNFYCQPQTFYTRNGILALLAQIDTRREFEILVEILRQLCQVVISFPIDRDGEGPYTFFYLMGKKMNKAIDLMLYARHIYRYFGDETDSVLRQLMIYNNVYVMGNEMDPNGFLTQFFLTRAENFITGYYNIVKILNAFLGQGAYQLTPTGGDMHCSGKKPYFMAYAAAKFVYKPRNMQLDFLLTNALRTFNSFLPDFLRPPVTNIHLFSDSTGYMEFVEHKTEMSMEEAQTYFVKFGALMVLIKLFGIHDLHRENIMATPLGPVIIDLECAMLPGLIKQESFKGFSLDIIKKAFLGKIMDNAVFYVNQQILPLSTEKFQHSIMEGFHNTAEICKKHKRELLLLYRDVLQSDMFVRLTHISTEEWYNEIRLFHLHPTHRAEILGRVLTMVLERTKEVVENQFGVRDIALRQTVIMQELLYSFTYGDVPLLRIRYYKGSYIKEIYINEKCIGTFSLTSNFYANLETDFLKQIDWLITTSAEDALKKEFF